MDSRQKHQRKIRVQSLSGLDGGLCLCRKRLGSDKSRYLTHRDTIVLLLRVRAFQGVSIMIVPLRMHRSLSKRKVDLGGRATAANYKSPREKQRRKEARPSMNVKHLGRYR